MDSPRKPLFETHADRITFGIMFTVATVIFSAGVVYNKIQSLETKLDKMEGIADRLTIVETKLNYFKIIP